MIELPFNSMDFAETWQTYLEHREDKKKPYKNNRSMDMALRKLVRLSHNNEEIAIAILENAISEDWQGFFPLDKKDPLMVKLMNTEVNKPQKVNSGFIIQQLIKQNNGLS